MKHLNVLATFVGVFWGIGASLLSATANAASCTGKIFAEGKRSEPPLYLFERNTKGSQSESLYKTPDGEIAVSELLELDPQGRVRKFSQDRKQEGHAGVMEARDGQLFFEWKKGEKLEQGKEARPEMLVVGPTLTRYLLSQWEPLLKGETTHVRYGVLDRQETVGFKFFKEREEKWGDREIVVIKMKPTSFVIAALVKPLLMFFDKNTHAMVEYRGRAIPKIKKDGKWEDLDAEIVYDCPPEDK